MLTCADVDDLIEPIAAGDIEPDAATRAHLVSCAACARALALAREIDGMLAAQPQPEPGADFTAVLLARLRRDRWRSEQALDLAFNVAIGLAVATFVGGLWMVLTASGLAAVSADLVRLSIESTSAVLASVAPALPMYALAAAVLVSGMALWWWAERGFGI